MNELRDELRSFNWKMISVWPDNYGVFALLRARDAGASARLRRRSGDFTGFSTQRQPPGWSRWKEVEQCFFSAGHACYRLDDGFWPTSRSEHPIFRLSSCRGWERPPIESRHGLRSKCSQRGSGRGWRNSGSGIHNISTESKKGGRPMGQTGSPQLNTGESLDSRGCVRKKQEETKPTEKPRKPLTVAAK